MRPSRKGWVLVAPMARQALNHVSFGHLAERERFTVLHYLGELGHTLETDSENQNERPLAAMDKMPSMADTQPSP